MVDRPSRRQPSRHHAAASAASAASVALGAAVLLGIAACGTPAADEPDAVAQPDTSPAPTPTPTPEAAEAPDLDAFAAIDRATWTTIAGDPAAAAGQQVVVFGVVERFFTSTGPGVLQARVTTAQPADATEGTAAIVRAQPDVLADVEVGDVIKVYAQVVGAFGGSSGATARTPELSAAAVEEVGPRDLAADVQLGGPVVAGAGVNVPVTITNSADVPMDYRVDVMAASADGARNYGTVTAYGEALAPGQAGESTARFSGALPAGVAFTVTNISRTPATP